MSKKRALKHDECRLSCVFLYDLFLYLLIWSDSIWGGKQNKAKDFCFTVLIEQHSYTFTLQLNTKST